MVLDFADMGNQAMSMIDSLRHAGIDNVVRMTLVIQTEDDEVAYQTSDPNPISTIDMLSRAITLECAYGEDDE